MSSRCEPEYACGPLTLSQMPLVFLFVFLPHCLGRLWAQLIEMMLICFGFSLIFQGICYRFLQNV